MKNEFLYQYSSKPGYTLVVGPKNTKLTLIEFGILRLRQKEEYQERIKDSESALVILSGVCKVEIDGDVFNSVGFRKDVFSGLPYAVYIPQNTTYKVVGEQDVEIAICKARVQRSTFNVQRSKLITPNDVKCRSVGRKNFKREVRDIVGEDFPANTLIVGETLSPPGNWSSFPPHKHDEDNPPFEAKLEEIYYFKVNPAQGFGIQRIYTDETDASFCVRDNSVVVIPKGYHPVVAVPGYSLYYLWVLAGDIRNLRYTVDPIHSWIK